MTKKFFSIVLSLVLVIGLLPVMNVSAETTVYIDDGFETYSQSAYNTDFSAGTSIYDTGDKTNYNHYWYAAQNMSLEIVDMSGPDGTMTKAAEITVNSCAVSSNTDGKTRFQLTKEGLGAGTGVVVHEMDIYIDDNTMSNVYINPIYIKGNRIGVGETQQNGHNTLKTVSNGWHHITAVTLLDGTEGHNVIGYLDGKCISYKEHTNTAGRMFQVYGKNLPGYKTLTLDNVKLYVNPVATSASSGIADSTSVSTKASPTVNFTNNILELSSHSDGIISAEKNIEFYKTGDQSATVAINELNVSEDGKSLEIVPVKDLEKGTSYTVTVKGLKDMYAQDIDPFTFSFTTAEDYNLSASQPVFTKVDLVNANVPSQNIEALENGYINAAFKLTSAAATDTQVMMIAVLKDGDDIKHMQFDTVTVPANGTYTYNAGFKVDSYLTQKIEVFAWDSLYGMTPLVSKYGISESGFTEVSFDN
ncbi:MAG: Ig-like domain-containing protein [Clostridia bacterium]|nr:Ig-like domain-containing protein [Clostridia bacterium]